MVTLRRKILQRVKRLIVGDTVRQVRKRIANEYLQGQGLEIGALHNPLPLPKQAQVRYVDRMSNAKLVEHYPDLGEQNLVGVDIIDDGEKLNSIPDDSQDFLIANHFLEHCQNPIGTLDQFLRVLRPNGVLYLALPDKRFTFDQSRDVTPIQHLWDDLEYGPQRSRRQHYEEFVQATMNLSDAVEVQAQADHYEKADYSIHFHVWSQHEMIEFILAMQVRLHFEIELIRKNGEEVVFILRKNQL